jgi:hypothetical protein
MEHTPSILSQYLLSPLSHLYSWQSSHRPLRLQHKTQLLVKFVEFDFGNFRAKNMRQLLFPICLHFLLFVSHKQITSPKSYEFGPLGCIAHPKCHIIDLSPGVTTVIEAVWILRKSQFVIPNSVSLVISIVFDEHDIPDGDIRAFNNMPRMYPTKTDTKSTD